MEFAYTSRAASGLPAAACLRIARGAWSFNLRMGLTGLLSLCDDRFTQVIEGPSSVLLPLSARILADRRHGSLTITAFGALGRRRHADFALEGFETGVPADTVACLPSAAFLDVEAFVPARARLRGI